MQNTVQQFTILAVDDNDLNLTVLERLLKQSGYKVLTAGTSRETKKLAIEEQPDLIFLDIMLPEESGFDILEFLKKTPETHSIPVIFITALTDLESKIKGFELGAIDYITKPFHPSEIRARLKNHLQLKLAQAQIIKAQAARLKQLQAAQTDLLTKPEQLPAAKFAVYYSSLQETGGDYYDVLEISDQVHSYFIGDIAGHDIKTSFITAALQPLLRQNCSSIYAPAESMSIINRILIDILPEDKFLTASYLVINRTCNKAELINMGHLPVIYRPNGSPAEKLELDSDILGQYTDAEFCKHSLAIHPGDRFYLLSDGLLEQQDSSEPWTDKIDQLVQFIDALPLGSLQDDIVTITTSLKQDNAPQKDDILLFAIEV